MDSTDSRIEQMLAPFRAALLRAYQFGRDDAVRDVLATAGTWAPMKTVRAGPGTQPGSAANQLLLAAKSSGAIRISKFAIERGISEGAARVAAHMLLKSGRLERVSRGVYRLPAEG